MRTGFQALFLIALAHVFASAPSHAAPVRTENTTVELVSEARFAAPGSTFWTALKVTPRPGWHTYWRNPGDSGMPTTIEWTLPNGARAGEISWPAPHAVPYGPLMNYGFGEEHWLLVPVTVPSDARSGTVLELEARADWLVCDDICIPEGADLSLTVPIDVNGTTDPAQASGFEQARAATPVSFEGDAVFQADESNIALKFPSISSDDTRFFPYQESLIRNNADQPAVGEAGALYLKMVRATAEPVEAIDGVLVAGDKAYEVALAPGAVTFPAAAQAPLNRAAVSLWHALALALLGGVLLNLMPCVFPVLSLKALSVVSASGLSLREKRLEGVSYTAGVIVSFLAIAAALLVIRAGGEAVGWGFQLQSPLIIALLAMLLFAVGLSLSGMFELGGRFTGLGQGLVDRGGNTGAFFTGILATIVATPCTAPFMATALGFAMTQSAGIALAVFLALGVGLALPMLLISEIPALGRMLPKPGAWMETFRQFLAFPIYGTVIWLIWVLGQQTGMNGVAALLAALMLIPLTVWLWQKRRDSAGTPRALATLVAGIAVIGMVSLVLWSDDQQAAPATAQASGIPYEPFSPDALATHRAEGTPVFVNFTAAWCITCLANEQVALTSQDVADYFGENGIVYMKGDWTRRDPVITETLAMYGRSGVPLYLYYPSGSDRVVVLPQLLTPGIVLTELTAADESARSFASAGRITP